MSNYSEKLVEDFYATANMYNQMKNKKVHYDDLPVVNIASLYLIEVIATNPDCNITEIADLLGVTRGAISQQTKKLEIKGLIKRYNTRTNIKEVYFSLTNDGKRLYEIHSNAHQKIYSNFEKVIDQFDENDLEKIHNFLRNFKLYMEEYNEKIEIK